jgi:hypothetical protein
MAALPGYDKRPGKSFWASDAAPAARSVKHPSISKTKAMAAPCRPTDLRPQAQGLASGELSQGVCGHGSLAQPLRGTDQAVTRADAAGCLKPHKHLPQADERKHEANPPGRRDQRMAVAAIARLFVPPKMEHVCTRDPQAGVAGQPGIASTLAWANGARKSS